LQLADDDAQRRLAQTTSTQQHTIERMRIIELRQLALETDITVALARSRSAYAVVRKSTEAIHSAQSLWQDANLPVAQAEVALASLENQRSEIAVVVARASDEFTAACAEVSAAQDKVNELAQAVGDSEEEGDFDPEGAEKAEREIVKLERKVASLGPVNALAPEQFEILDGQVNTVKNNRGDLAHASRDIKVLIDNLREESERRFEVVFEETSQHFQSIFSEFFSGGRATLRLEEIVKLPQANAESEPVVPVEEGEDEVQVAGVEILAQPPGKRLQPLSLLSGGERALTALALILALQKVNPSPFYLFDEVDAPLDDTNVLRFTRMLRRLSQEQQFLVITHNHVTMAAADALYGVAIDGEGISSLVSVRFQEGEIEVVGRKQAVAVAS
jgi:chromosome segregation protein